MVLLNTIKKRYEGVCNKDGYILKNSIELLNRSIGNSKIIDNKPYIIYDITYKAKIISPDKPKIMFKDVAGQDLENPAYSTSVGVLQWGARGFSQASSSNNGHSKSSNLYKRIRSWLSGRMKGLVPA